jgi:hypothetical protein
MSSCNNSGSEAKTFCDTACRTKPFEFSASHPLEPRVTISVRNCLADTLTWTHKEMQSSSQVQLGGFFNESIRISESAVDVYFKDTSYAWLSFNNCETGRGYLVKMPFNKAQNIRRMNKALNRFDPKFNVAADMRAFADNSNIYVVNVNNDHQDTLKLGGTYEIDFDDVHKTIDSVHITPTKIFARMIKDGKPVDVQREITF